MLEDIRQKKSLSIQKKLLSLPQYITANTLMIFCSFESEINTKGVIRYSLDNGKRVVVPKVSLRPKCLLLSELKDYEKGLEMSPPYGILEPPWSLMRPVCPAELELVIVPGVVFDREGGRIGYGAGFYDRFFEKVPTNTWRVALAFDLQVVDRVPVEPHDQFIDILVSEKEVLYFKRHQVNG